MDNITTVKNWVTAHLPSMNTIKTASKETAIIAAGLGVITAGLRFTYTMYKDLPGEKSHFQQAVLCVSTLISLMPLFYFAKNKQKMQTEILRLQGDLAQLQAAQAAQPAQA